jgi:hypothetical protein
MIQSSADRYNYYLRIQTPRNSHDELLLRYLKAGQEPCLSHQKMALMAFRAYWLPAAYAQSLKDGHRLSEREFRQLVRVAIADLREQANTLQQQFLFEVPLTASQQLLG